jgi:hypothetical protein
MAPLEKSAYVEQAVHVFHSTARDTRVAVEETLDGVRADSAALTLLFHSPQHDADIVAEVCGRRIGTRGVSGSTAGEITSCGFQHGTMTALALHGPHVRAAATLLPRLEQTSLIPVSAIAARLAERIGRSLDELDPDRHIWMMLYDGLSGQEDFLTPVFATRAPRLPLVGGSFGDEDQFQHVNLVFDGQLYSGAGAVVLLEYDRPFQPLHHTHMEFTEHWFEVTRTERGGRILLDLDGRPVEEVYAEALGIDESDITLDVTGRRPFGYRFKGRPFPCSVMTALDRGFFLAYSVQVGDRINLLEPVDMVAKTERVVRDSLQELERRGGTPQAMLLFHCLGRYLEASHDGIIEPLHRALNQVPLCGLNTYGEQFGPRHMNHSVTGILFG